MLTRNVRPWRVCFDSDPWLLHSLVGSLVLTRIVRAWRVSLDSHRRSLYSFMGAQKVAHKEFWSFFVDAPLVTSTSAQLRQSLPVQPPDNTRARVEVVDAFGNRRAYSQYTTVKSLFWFRSTATVFLCGSKKNANSELNRLPCTLLELSRISRRQSRSSMCRVRKLRQNLRVVLW